MNRHFASATILLACLFAVLGGLPEIAHADNNPDFYSGNYSVLGGVSYSPGQNFASTGTTYDSQYLNFYFQFVANVSNFQETPYCGLGCPQYYSGNINSGSVQFLGYDASGQNPNYDFAGIIEAGGTLNGEIVCDNQGCAWQNEIDINYQSTSAGNGWQSSGSLSYMDGNDGSGGGGFGSLTLATQQVTTPEPSSLVLFGSGVVGLGGVLRRRLR